MDATRKYSCQCGDNVPSAAKIVGNAIWSQRTVDGKKKRDGMAFGEGGRYPRPPSPESQHRLCTSALARLSGMLRPECGPKHINHYPGNLSRAYRDGHARLVSAWKAVKERTLRSWDVWMLFRTLRARSGTRPRGSARRTWRDIASAECGCAVQPDTEV